MTNTGRSWVSPSVVACGLLLSLSSVALAQTVTGGSTGTPLDQPQLFPAEQKMPAFSRIFTDTANDFARLSKKQSLAWLSLGGGAALLAHTQDARVSTWVGSSDTVGSTKVGTTVGSFPFQFGAAMTTLAVARMANNPKAANVAVDLAQAQLVAQGVTYAFKYAAQRTRPDGSARSFPSGHTSVTFASATVLQRHFGWKVGIPAYAVATYVGASRLESNRHFLSDVAFGAALGIVAGRTVTIGKGNARFAVVPSAGIQSAAVSFTWVGKN